MKKNSNAHIVSITAANIRKKIQLCFACLRVAAPPVKVTNPINARTIIGVVDRARTVRKMKGNSSINPSPTRAVPIGFLWLGYFRDKAVLVMKIIAGIAIMEKKR